MYIANPIYDVVFKYLMEDNRIAKKFISAIIGEKIEKLTVVPKKYICNFDSKLYSNSEEAMAELQKIRIKIEKVQSEIKKLQPEC